MAEIYGEVHHLKVTASGQVSVPAAVRRRWATAHVRVTDAGDHLIIEPETENPFAGVRGVVRTGLALSSEEMRRRAREEDAAIEARKRAR